MDEMLQRIAAAYGIAPEYHDVFGKAHTVSDATLRAILAAMHVDAASGASGGESARIPHRLAPMTVVRSNAKPWRVRASLPEAIAARRLAWRITSEEGGVHACPLTPRRIEAAARNGASAEARVTVDLDVDVALPEGYHELVLVDGEAEVARGKLAVAPATCYRPPELREGRRLWGVAAQLYGVRSARDWGIGDFTDLATLVEQSAAAGADVIGVNPLHALFPHDPERASPYSPSSRSFLNVLYLDVEAIPEFARCDEAREKIRSDAFLGAVSALRLASLVDYAGVAAQKLPLLRMVYAQALRDRDDRGASTWQQFEAYRAARGEALQRHALCEALQAHFFARDPAVWGWPAWPDPYRDPDATDVKRFADEHADEVGFHAWMQWHAELQRAHVAEVARRHGLALGLYVDLAVSIDPGGAEAWAQKDLYATKASVGAPPDAFNAKGQDWGLPPMIPERLHDAGYAPFIAMLRANMRDAGALRIDHVMGLVRLYWVPSGMSAAEGAYVHYPHEDLLGLLALESHRHRCLVIGEDLGTVPDVVRQALAANDVLSYRVLFFERDAAEGFLPPAAYPEAALAVASTHDLPTLAGWWEGRDVRLRAEQGQLGPNANVDAEIDGRVRDRGRLLAVLDRERLLPEGVPLDPYAVPELTQALAYALQLYLARTPSALLMIQLEDIFGVREQANLPGTTTAHPNWRRKLPVTLEQQGTDGRIGVLASGIVGEGRGRM
jgi:4-alpha-glucanotransferase